MHDNAEVKKPDTEPESSLEAERSGMPSRKVLDEYSRLADAFRENNTEENEKALVDFMVANGLANELG